MKTHIKLILTATVTLLITFLAVRTYSSLVMTRKLDYVIRHLQDRERYSKVWFDALSRRVEITAYNPIMEQTDDYPWETASGRLASLQSLAVSRDLLMSNGGPFDYGDTVYVVVPFIVDDTMNKRYRKRIDIFLERHWAAKIWGQKVGWVAN